MFMTTLTDNFRKAHHHDIVMFKVRYFSCFFFKLLFSVPDNNMSFFGSFENNGNISLKVSAFSGS